MVTNTATTVESMETEFYEALINWIVEKFNYFHTVEYNPFRDIFHVANKDRSERSRRTIQRRVLNRANKL